MRKNPTLHFITLLRLTSFKRTFHSLFPLIDVREISPSTFSQTLNLLHLRVVTFPLLSFSHHHHRHYRAYNYVIIS